MKALLIALIPALIVSTVSAVETGTICGIVFSGDTGAPCLTPMSSWSVLT